jgi:hypothetical protein
VCVAGPRQNDADTIEIDGASFVGGENSAACGVHRRNFATGTPPRIGRAEVEPEL